MSRGVNKVTIIGNCGQDPDTKYFPDGGAVTNITIATSEAWKDKQGKKQERTEWHRVVFHDRGNYRLGQIAGEYLRKGSKVYVEGSLRTRQWEKDGVKHYTTEVIASELQMLTPPATQQGAIAPQQAPAQVSDGFDDMDPDIPF